MLQYLSAFDETIDPLDEELCAAPVKANEEPVSTEDCNYSPEFDTTFTSDSHQEDVPLESGQPANPHYYYFYQGVCMDLLLSNTVLVFLCKKPNKLSPQLWMASMCISTLSMYDA